jgi:AraC-like DNA-binding protein
LAFLKEWPFVHKSCVFDLALTVFCNHNIAYKRVEKDGRRKIRYVTMQTAKPEITGYAWRGATDVNPRLTAVFQCLCSRQGLGSYRHPQWILDYSFTPFGSFRVKRNSGPWLSRPAHEAHLYAPGTRYWEDTSKCGVKTAHAIYIGFTGGEHCGLTHLAASGSYARFADPEGQLGQLLTRLLTLAQNMNETNFWDGQSLLCAIIGLLHGAEPAGTGRYLIRDGSATPERSEIVDKVRRYCQDHFAQPVSRQDMARSLNMSVSTLAHRYREETGESPIATLMSMRINLAKGLLLKGNRLKTIADQTGFCDAFQLSKIFKRREGLSPRAFLASLKTTKR